MARLLIGILSTTPNIDVKIKGDHSLNKRSMKKLINLLSEFGATFLPRGKDKFPLKFISSNFPVAIKYKAGVSAQLKSAAILAEQVFLCQLPPYSPSPAPVQGGGGGER